MFMGIQGRNNNFKRKYPAPNKCVYAFLDRETKEISLYW